MNSVSEMRKRISVVQLGARMHYAVPRVLEQAGMLELFFTDLSAQVFYLNRVARLLRRVFRFSKVERLLQRQVQGVPRAKIINFPLLALKYDWALKQAATDGDLDEAHLHAGDAIGRAAGRRGLGRAAAVYAFNSAASALFAIARSLGMRTILEQTIAPRIIEREMLRQERGAWPGWERSQSERDERVAQAVCRREAEEWAAADVILCGSEFVQRGIELAGGPVEKCRIVPYGVDGIGPPMVRWQSKAQSRFRVLFVGSVGLRKGVQYLLEAAERLRSTSIEFRVVGPLHVGAIAATRLQRTVSLVGPRPRGAIPQEYAQADVVVLPTLLEGSATVCYEAMAAGRPVITTPNAGSVVRNGVDGYIVPARDAEMLASCIAKLATEPDRARQMGISASQRAAEYTVARYGERLLAAIEPVVSGLVSRE
jgi:glycosyltransferase involved in cell wall biosynthesis